MRCFFLVLALLYFSPLPATCTDVNVSIPLRKGWNLISLPYAPVDGTPSVVLDGIDMSNASLQLWDNARDFGGGYLIYNQNWFGPMKTGDAYWFVESGSKTLSYLAYPNDLEPKIITIPAHTRYPYWIMIGMPFDKKIACSNILFSIDGTNFVPWANAVQDTDKKWLESAAQGWVASDQGFFNASCVGSFQKDYLEPWFGYLILIKTANDFYIKIPTSPIVP